MKLPFSTTERQESRRHLEWNGGLHYLPATLLRPTVLGLGFIAVRCLDISLSIGKTEGTCFRLGTNYSQRTTMKAVVASGSHTNSITVSDRDRADVGPGQSLVRICSATVNQLSNSIRHQRVAGTSFPLVLGNEAAGLIEVSSTMPAGTPVVIFGGGQLGVTQDGLMQQWAVVDDRRLFSLPRGLTMDQGAAASVNYITAWRALRLANVGPGVSVLITGGTGALGHALRELAEQRGAIVTIAVSTTTKAEQAKAMGARSVLNLAEGSILKTAQDMDVPGFSVVMDTVGGQVLAEAAAALAPRGTAIAIGFAAGTETTLDLVDIIVHEKRIVGYDLHLETDESCAEAFSEVAKLMAAGGVRPAIDSTFELQELSEAYDRLESRKSVGAIVLHLH